MLVLALVAPVLTAPAALATSLGSETFGGIATPANGWVSGGSGGSVACLTGATSSASNSIPACSGGPLDSAGSGALQLTPAAAGRSGFAIYNTPISASDGLNIAFDMYQYHGTGADGISFFLIDGTANPTMPGAPGGSLGYASSGVTPGLVGGYVGVGFDRFGNFSNPAFGTGGNGAHANSITIRGSEASGYNFVTQHAAAGALGVEAATTRTTAKRHVVISISTNNIMSVSVDYGSGPVSEVSALNLATINTGGMPSTFKFGFAASTGGSNNIHEIQGLTVDTLPPSMSVAVGHTPGSFVQGATGDFTLTATNDASAQPTNGTIIVTHTLPAGITPTSAAGTGWTCGIAGQVVTCSTPGSGGSVLAAGASKPAITVHTSVASNAPTGSIANTVTVDTPLNAGGAHSTTDHVTVVNGDFLDGDGVFNAVEDAAPGGGDANNDGIFDSGQARVTSLMDPISNHYAVLDVPACTGNNSVSVAAAPTTDGSYQYPAGMMNFTLTCGVGATATVTMYYYGLPNTDLVLRKYDTAGHSYATVPGATFQSVTIGGQAATKITYPITDGGVLDADGVANGTIIDPAGPAVLAAVAPVVTAPNTGLPTRSTAVYYLAGLLGIGLLGYEVRTTRRSRKTKISPLARS